jgi:predicted nucleotidyltransferase
MASDRSTKQQRDRFVIALLNEKLDHVRHNLADVLHLDQVMAGPLRQRLMAWRLGSQEFHAMYHEIDGVPGSAVLRIRTQPHVPDSPPDDNWRDVATFGELDDLMRSALKQKRLTPGDLKAIEGNKKHLGERPDNVILLGYTGSHAYGLNHGGFLDADGEMVAPSDVDLRGVYVVPTRDVLALGGYRKLVETADADTKFDEVERFLELCLKANPERMEMLGCPRKAESTPIGNLLVENMGIFLSKRVIKTYGGYAKGQLYRIERRRDRSSKPVMHLIRLMLSGIKILKDGELNPDMGEFRTRLLGIRKGEVALEEAFDWHQRLEIEFARAAETTKLPDEPNVEKANCILLEIRRHHLDWS